MNNEKNYIHTSTKAKKFKYYPKRKIEELLNSYTEIIQLDYSNLLDLGDKKISLDDMHLTIEGNTKLADKLYTDIKIFFENN